MSFLVIDEAAAFLHMSPETLRRKAKSGEAPAAKLGKNWIFFKEDLIKYVRSKYHGKSIAYATPINLKEGKTCHFTNEKGQNQKFGKSISRHQTEKEYANLLGLKIG